jgi:hypothetical protein
MKYIFQFRRSFLLYYFLFKLEKNCNIYRFKRNGRVGFFLFSQERKTDEKNNGYVVFILKYPGITWEKYCWWGGVALLRPPAPQSKYIYIKSITVCVPSSEYSPNPTLASGCAPPPRTGGGVGGRRDTRLWVRGWGSPNSDDLRKSLVLCLLCAPPPPFTQ